ncbi:MAG: HAMP domain-containing protein, partial [Planctomycetes bacterium]|nr:HAMP domain-containing protein [Planctomycetota bacterium]
MRSGARFFWQLYAGYVLLVVVFAAVVAASLSHTITDHSLQEIRNQLRAKAILLSVTAEQALDDDPAGALQRTIQQLSPQVDTELAVITESGKVLASSTRRTEQIGQPDQPEIQQAREQGEGYAQRFSPELGKEALYHARKIESNNKKIGYVRTALPTDVIEEYLGRVRRLVFLAALFAALVALGLGLLVARRVTAPLSKMTEAARSIADGDFARRVAIDSSNEIRDLANAFNTMAEQLNMRIDTITKERRMLQTILSGMVEGVVAIDHDERVVHMNGVAAGLLEVDASRSIGARIWEATRVNEIAKALTSSLSGGREVRTQARLLRNGGEALVEINAAPLHDGDQELVGAVVVFHDVTEVRRLELVRREFVTNASHELKTPITAIRGFLETLAANPEMPPETRHRFITRAAGQGSRLSTLVTDLLRLSQLESKERPDSFEAVDLREVVRGSVRDLGTFASEKGVDLRYELGDQPVLARSDAPTLSLIIDNLVDNAIKYTRTGGKVVLRAFPNNNFALIEVQDNGIGIDPVHQARIFERFYRIDKARSRELGGTGLGLAIVKH